MCFHLSYHHHGPSKHVFFQIDIDDIFVGKNRLLPSDVDALLESQKRIQKMVPGFRYNLGFSGGVFKTGNYEEQVTFIKFIIIKLPGIG